jgi:RHS repeat-associated protein
VIYDALGRIVERACSDGHVDRIEWDPRSLIARASNDRVGVVFERDLAGRVVRETQTFDGVAHEVRTTYDPSGNLIERSTDRGWIERIERDARGLRARTWFDGVSIAHERDPLGRERNRHLPGNARIESTFDESGLLLRRAVLGPQAGQMDHVAPPWVGNVAAERVDLRYRYDRLHAVEAWDPDAGVTTFHLDPFGALLARLPAIARPQSFAYDDRRDVHEQGPDARPRSYGAGSRLLRRGAVEYVWNDAGRLAEKIEGDGDDARVTRYEWNTLGMLVAVDLPDGRRCEFAYDPFFRRIHKEVSGGDERSTTRFVWDSDVLVQEIRARGEVVEERSYVFDDVGFEPLAQVVTRDGAHLRHHYVLDRVGAPHRLVGDDGRVAAAYEHEAFALVPRDETAADTPIGLLGQYRDDETGLAYNRYRYYDPEIQQFLSPDPLGLQAGIHDRGGPANTYEEVDPLGLVLNTQALAAVNKIPSGTAGVYVIESADGKTKYVGSAKDVKARLKCGKHKKAHDLLNQPGTKVSVHPVDVSGVKGHTWKNPAKGGKTETVSKDRAITRTLLVEETRRFRDARPEGSTVTLTNSHQPLSAAKFHVYESQYPPVAGASLQAIAI